MSVFPTPCCPHSELVVCSLLVLRISLALAYSLRCACLLLNSTLLCVLSGLFTNMYRYLVLYMDPSSLPIMFEHD